jgi:hypothetical protein
MRSKPWNEQENIAIVALYFTMLDAAIAGIEYNKASAIRAARGENPNPLDNVHGAPLADRGRGSIEFKLMNATAAHQDINANAETMHNHGYRALPNYQADLKVAMQAGLDNRYHQAPGGERFTA